MRSMKCEIDTSTSTWSFLSVIRGYHVYKDIWEAVEGEILDCIKGRTNILDPFALGISLIFFANFSYL